MEFKHLASSYEKTMPRSDNTLFNSLLVWLDTQVQSVTAAFAVKVGLWVPIFLILEKIPKSLSSLRNIYGNILKTCYICEPPILGFNSTVILLHLKEGVGRIIGAKCFSPPLDFSSIVHYFYNYKLLTSAQVGLIAIGIFLILLLIKGILIVAFL